MKVTTALSRILKSYFHFTFKCRYRNCRIATMSRQTERLKGSINSVYSFCTNFMHRDLSLKFPIQKCLVSAPNEIKVSLVFIVLKIGNISNETANTSQRLNSQY